MLGDSFFVPFFLLVHSIVYATSLITVEIWESNIHSLSLTKKKKKAAKR